MLMKHLNEENFSLPAKKKKNPTRKRMCNLISKRVDTLVIVPPFDTDLLTLSVATGRIKSFEVRVPHVVLCHKLGSAHSDKL